MIERYTLPEMGQVWSDAHKYELWCRVETLVLEAHARAGTVPASAVGPVRSAPPPTPEAVAAIEAVTEHDVIAFLTAWADNTEPRSAAAYVHYGMTSSDLLDTALAVQLAEATDIIVAKADRLVAVLRDHALANGLHPGPRLLISDQRHRRHRSGAMTALALVLKDGRDILGERNRLARASVRGAERGSGNHDNAEHPLQHGICP